MWLAPVPDPALPLIAAAAISAGTSLFQGYQAKKSEKEARQMAEGEKANALKMLTQAGSTDAFFQALQEAQLKTGHKAARAGFSGARKATELGADAARRTVLNQGQRTQADATQALISRGLTGTTAGTGVANDLAGQTTQQLAAIDQQLATAFANLDLEEGELAADQSEELAQLIGSGRGFQQQIGLMRPDFAPAGKVKKKSGNFFSKVASFAPAGLMMGM